MYCTTPSWMLHRRCDYFDRVSIICVTCAAADVLLPWTANAQTNNLKGPKKEPDHGIKSDTLLVWSGLIKKRESTFVLFCTEFKLIFSLNNCLLVALESSYLFWNPIHHQSLQHDMSKSEGIKKYDLRFFFPHKVSTPVKGLHFI